MIRSECPRLADDVRTDADDTANSWLLVLREDRRAEDDARPKAIRPPALDDHVQFYAGRILFMAVLPGLLLSQSTTHSSDSHCH